jgi:hypothetical protein
MLYSTSCTCPQQRIYVQNYVVACFRVFDQYEIDIEVKKHRHSYLGREAVHPPVM